MLFGLRLRYARLLDKAVAVPRTYAFVLTCAEVFDHLYNDDEASAEEGDVPGRVGCRTRTSTDHGSGGRTPRWIGCRSDSFNSSNLYHHDVITLCILEDVGRS